MTIVQTHFKIQCNLNLLITVNRYSLIQLNYNNLNMLVFYLIFAPLTKNK